jgi:hypothetical protein
MPDQEPERSLDDLAGVAMVAGFSKGPAMKVRVSGGRNRQFANAQ